MFADIKLLSDLHANINGGRITINGKLITAIDIALTDEQYNRRSAVLAAAQLLSTALEDCAKAYNV